MSSLTGNKRGALIEGPIGKTLTRMLLGMLIGHFAMTIFNLTDTYFVAKLGTEELAAMSFTFPVIFTIMSLIFGLGIGASSIISQAIGKDDEHSVQQLTAHVLLLGLILAIFLSVIGYCFVEPLFYAMGARDEVLALTAQYMRIWFLGMPMVAIPMLGNNVLRGTGDTKTPGLIMASGSVINVIMDPILIFGLAGVPAMGITGAAIATVFGRGFAMLCILYVLIHRNKMLVFEKASLSVILKSWRKLTYIGMPAAITGALGPITGMIIVKLVSGYGVDAVAAVGAGSRIDSFVMMVLGSLGMVLMPFIGQNFGAGRLDRIRQSIRWSSRFCLIWGTLCYLLMFLLARPISQIFSSEADVIDLIVLYLIFHSFSLGMAGVWRMISMSMNGLHQPFHSGAINVISLLVLGLPCLVVGSYFYGIKGLFLGMAIGNVLAAMVALVWMNSLLNRMDPPASSELSQNSDETTSSEVQPVVV